MHLLPFSGPAARQAGSWLLLGLIVALTLAPEEAAAQRPYRIIDPFYRNETARRAFFDRYAVTGEAAYRPAGILQEDGLPASTNGLVFTLRFDYQLTSRFDVGAIMDADVGNTRTVSLSWIVLKYYRYLENSDYAFRLAVDPASDGRIGFPQIDLAWLYTSLLAPVLSTDLAFGVRRVRVGFSQFLPPEPISPEGPFTRRPHTEVLFTRAHGTEIHMMMNYNLHFDPAGSNVFFALLGEGGTYDLVETPIRGTGAAAELRDLSRIGDAEDDARKVIDYLGGTIWVRGGVEFSRPRYQISPYLSIPLQQWLPEAEEGTFPSSRLDFGLRFMLR